MGLFTTPHRTFENKHRITNNNTNYSLALFDFYVNTIVQQIITDEKIKFISAVCHSTYIGEFTYVYCPWFDSVSYEITHDCLHLPIGICFPTRPQVSGVITPCFLLPHIFLTIVSLVCFTICRCRMFLPPALCPLRMFRSLPRMFSPPATLVCFRSVAHLYVFAPCHRRMFSLPATLVCFRFLPPLYFFAPCHPCLFSLPATPCMFSFLATLVCFRSVPPNCMFSLLATLVHFCPLPPSYLFAFCPPQCFRQLPPCIFLPSAPLLCFQPLNLSYIFAPCPTSMFLLMCIKRSRR